MSVELTINGDVRRMRLRDGDTILVTLDRMIGSADADEIRARIGDAFPGHQVLVLAPGMEVSVIGPGVEVVS